jgi:hypothetical protein
VSSLILHLRRRATDDRGAILILAAIGLPAFLLFGAFVINVGNWWVHKRHLQVQADAAALAGAMSFTYPDCDNGLIANSAIQYSGGRELQIGDDVKLGSQTFWNAPPAAWPGFTPQQNLQLGGANNRTIVRTGVNRPNVFGREATVDTPADLGDAATYNATDASTKPCAKGFVDVKMTEARDTSAGPFHFLTAWWLPHYNDAQARVSLQKAKSLDNLLPIGVEDVNPKRAHVWFYDEDDVTHTVLGEAELYRHGSAGGLAVYDNSIANGTSTDPITFSPHAERIGVKIALSGSDASVSCSATLVVCFGSETNGLTRVRGFDTSGSGARLGAVNLFNPACPVPDNGYFNTVCTADRITTSLQGVSTAEDSDKVVVTAKIGSHSAVALHYCSTTGLWQSVTKNGNNPPNCDTWTTLPIDPGTGTQKIIIAWEQQGGTFNGVNCSKPSPCNVGTATDAHKVFSGTTESDSAGPIKQLQINAADGTTDVNNVARCAAATACPASFVVRIALFGQRSLAAKADPPVALKVFKADRTSPSLKHQLDCDPGLNQQEDEIATGCAPEYTINTGQTCGTTGQDRNDLWASPQPWPCVAVDTGTNENASAEGLNARVLCFPANSAGNCHAPGGNLNNPNLKLPYNPHSCTNWNRWPDWRDSNIPIPDDDPRRIAVFLVPFGTFDNGGQGTIPVLDFAEFYVTGWHGKGNDDNPCDGFNAHRDEYWDDSAPGGSNKNNITEISGHFIKQIVPNTGDTQGACDPLGLTPCVAVMTK